MKLRKKIIAGMLAASLAVTALAGCGDSKDDEKENVETTAPAEQDTADDAADSQEDSDAPDTSEEEDLPDSLKEAYKDMFQIGVAVNSWQLADEETLDFIKKHFTSITCENEMKPDYVLDYDATVASEDGMPEINTETMDNIMTMAEDAGLKMRGHTLVWHSQTPEWLFHKDYDESKDYVDRKTMLKRMDAYIKKVLTFCNEKHPGTVYAWDVVNESASDDPNKGLRDDSPWYITIGEDYIEKAFETARKYADKDVKLFLNDYSTEVPEKRKTLYEIASKLYDKGIIDGFGMQSHHDREYYDTEAVKTTIMTFAQLEGLEIQLTEIDLHYNDNSEEALNEQAEKYGELFGLLTEIDTEEYADITGVTFWGLNDGNTWLTGHKKEDSYPLLFDADNNPKPAFDAVIKASRKEDIYAGMKK